MRLLKDYAAQALECREAAAKAQTKEARDGLLQMADHWETLARQRAAYLHLEDMLADLLRPRSNDNDAPKPA
jgi:hypothetical protein